jgi:hypothetical protein
LKGICSDQTPLQDRTEGQAEGQVAGLDAGLAAGVAASWKSGARPRNERSGKGTTASGRT